MKRLLALVLVIVIVMAFSSCGENKITSSIEEQGSSGANVSSKAVASENEQKHIHNYIPEKVAATCTQQGYTLYRCACGSKYKDNYVKAAHKYTSKKVSATCTQQGYTLHKCSACGKTYKDNYVESKHNYVNYVCTKCNSVDKAHAYEYLVSWIKKNGKVNGEYVGVRKYVNSDDHQLGFGVLYSESGEYAYIEFAYYEDENAVKDSVYLNINLSDQNQQYTYWCAYGNDPTEYEVSGTIKAKTYTTNTPLNCDKYIGNSEDRTTVTEATRGLIAVLLQTFSDYLDQNIPELSITDFGFEAFES